MSGKNNNNFIKSNKSLIYLNFINFLIPYNNGIMHNYLIVFKTPGPLRIFVRAATARSRCSVLCVTKGYTLMSACSYSGDFCQTGMQ